MQALRFVVWKKAGLHVKLLNLVADLHLMMRILIVLLNGSRPLLKIR